MKVLQLTVHLFPNVGGVETHLSDLFKVLIKRYWEVFVLAYQPLSTKTKWKIFEKEKNLTILRIPWLKGFFERLVSFPVLEFAYLVPGLFVTTPFIILFFRPDIIHAHGLSAAVAAVFWGKFFKVRTIISLHSIYTFPKNGLYHDFVKFLLRNADFVLSLSRKSNQEVKALGVENNKSGAFTYWIDFKKFKILNFKFKIKRKLEWEEKFIVLFVGRLIKEKGIDILLESARLWNKNIRLVIIGAGPMEEELLKEINQMKKVQFLGKIEQPDLPLYYSAADCLIVPSISEEGFGRVIIESLACGTPVIASRKGAIPEAMDETVGRFIKATSEDIKDEISYLYKNPSVLQKLAKKTRKFVERRYSERNVEKIIKAYTG